MADCLVVTSGQKAVLYVFVTLLLCAGLAAGLAGAQGREASLVADLREHGVETVAHDAEMRPAAGRSETLRVRAAVDLPDGARVVELRAVAPNGASLPRYQWSPAPSPYEGEFTVRYDLDDPGRVVAQSDLDDHESLDPRVLWTVAGALGVVTALWAWPTVRVLRVRAPGQKS